MAEALELFDRRPASRLGYRLSSIEQKWRDELERAGVNVSPRARIRDLPIESLQGIEIVRALASQAQVLILDEPTAALPPPAVDRLFARLRDIRQRGVTILIILHKVREVLDLADSVSVLRGGRLVLSPTPSRELDAYRLADLIIGSSSATAGLAPADVAVAARADLGLSETLERPAVGRTSSQAVATTNEVALVLDGVATGEITGEAPLRGLSVSVRRGEIVGIAGVEGNGQRALVRAVAGLVATTAGTIHLGGHDVTHRTTGSRRRLGLHTIPFDRNTEGISVTSPIWENVAIGSVVERRRPGLLLHPSELRRLARKALSEWKVQFRDLDQRAGELSGGNAQRLVFARELGASAAVMVAAQPTRGLDVSGTAFVHRTLRDVRDKGTGVLLASSDLDELFALSDRIVVLLGGAVVAEFVPPYDRRAVGAAMVGAT